MRSPTEWGNWRNAGGAPWSLLCVLGLCAASLSTVACGDDNGSGGDDDSSAGDSSTGGSSTGGSGKGGSTGVPCSPAPPERGTAACKRWHAAICSWAQGCGVIDGCVCMDQASAIACTSDATATSCAERLDTPECTTTVVMGCDFTDLADRAAAQAGCQEYLQRLCASNQRCTAEDPATCVADLMTTVNCTQAAGLKPAFDDCLVEIDTLACDATELPASCLGSLLLFQ